MKTKQVYQTNHVGLYVGAVLAEESPLEPGVFLIPGGCVTISPPEAPEFKAARWTGKTWELLDYFAGLIVYKMADREPLTLTGTGPIPSGYTLKKPAENQVWKSGRWVDDLDTTLAKLYQDKVDAINTACAQHIEGGFDCDALGETHRYNSTLEDQVNLSGLILSTMDALCACYRQGEKAFRSHTAEQLHQVGQSLVQFKQSALQQAEVLKNALSKALADKDLPAMKGINWVQPK
jgi:hypothetical protein